MNKVTLLSIPLLLASFYANAGFSSRDSYFNEPFDVFSQDNGWSEFAYSGSATSTYNGVTRSDGTVGPGGGGQKFDAEFLFYKYDDATNKISIGLQSGFDIIDGHYRPRYSGTDYYAGDLALSFNGLNSGEYEYAIDFGLLTKTYNNGNSRYYNPQSLGKQTAGLYDNLTWNNDILHNASSPFAVEVGNLRNDINVDFSVQGKGRVDETIRSGRTNYSYYRVATFSLDNIVNTSENFTVDAHWTMSCGNDDINGNVEIAGRSNPIPEPTVIALMGIGSMSIILSGLRRRKSLKSSTIIK